MSELKALGYSLANWHHDTVGRGEHDCGCCEYVHGVARKVTCIGCPMNPSGRDYCCNGLWLEWDNARKDGNYVLAYLIADKIYDFILEKYWEADARMMMNNNNKTMEEN
jgi:hypothetical protein